MRDPDINREWHGDKDQLVNTGVGWSLSWGCRLSFGYDYDGNLCATVNTSGTDQQRGIVNVAVTWDQVREFARMILNGDFEPVPFESTGDAA